MAKKAPAKAPAKRKPRAKNRVPADSPFELSEFSPETLKRLQEILDAKNGPSVIHLADEGEPVDITSWIPPFLKAVLLIAVGAIGGVWFAGGIDVSPSPGPSTSDCLSQSHAADRVSQIRILREYAGKSFADEPTAQKWLNDQRIEARKADWIPYTDELGAAADSGADAVKALADKLEDAR